MEKTMTREDAVQLVEQITATCLSCPLWRKANNFRGLLEFVLSYVATIKLAYKENIPCLNSINMLQ